MANLDIRLANNYFRSGRIYIGTTPLVIGSPALTNRKSLGLINFGTVNLYVGSSGFTTGFPYYPGASDTLPLGPGIRLFGKAAASTGSIDVRYFEYA